MKKWWLVLFLFAFPTMCHAENISPSPTTQVSPAVTPTSETPAVTAETPILQMPVFSDTHVSYNSPLGATRLELALEDYDALAPHYQALAVVGDLTNTGRQSEYNDFFRILNAHANPNVERIITMGNHEYLYGQIDPSYNSSMIQKGFVANTDMPNFYYDKWVDGYHFISLSSETIPMWVSAETNGATISDTQYNWLKQKLSENADPMRPIFVFLHQPIPNTTYGSEEWNDQLYDGKLTKILQQYPQVILFSGHTHYLLNHPRMVYQNGFTMVNTGAVIGGYYDGGSVSDLFQGLLVNVYKDKVEIKAREFSNHTWIQTFTIPIPFKQTYGDTEPPTFTKVVPPAVFHVTGTSASVIFPKATDNTAVTEYEIRENGNVIGTDYVKFWDKATADQTLVSTTVSNLLPNHEYHLEVVAVDGYGNRSADSLPFTVHTGFQSGWVFSNQHWFYFQPNGTIATGWVQSGGKWYYLNQDGTMETGWLLYRNQRYYLNPKGDMATGWIWDGSHFYYLKPNGVMATGWILDKGKWYYLASSGDMKTGWITVNGHRYYLGIDGALKK